MKVENKDNIQQIGLFNFGAKAKIETNIDSKIIFKTKLLEFKNKINLIKRYQNNHKKIKEALLALDENKNLKSKIDELNKEIIELNNKISKLENDGQFIPNSHHKNILRLVKEQGPISVEKFSEKHLNDIDYEISYSELVDNLYLLEYTAYADEEGFFSFLAVKINSDMKTEILKIIK